ncbi:MAG: glutamate-5-semialdehyde dehydrogenase [Oligosphaeraceae bacterium]|nr:glutamate-5-semialdehyde dehydrogenase [Oligosphaeraceae bacterium]
MSIRQKLKETGQKARVAALELSVASAAVRQSAIEGMAARLLSAYDEIMQANQLDMAKAAASAADEAFLKRLQITEKIFSYMHERLLEAAKLPDPLGIVIEGHVEPSGLQVSRVSVPLGVIGIIYEARPNVTTDAAAVALKSGNAVILRGGSEAWQTNGVLVRLMREAIVEQGLPADAVQTLSSPDRAAVRELLRLDKYVDVIIPRGGKSLIKAVSSQSRIPVIKHYDGICHLYLAADADIDMAIALTVNSKCQRVEVCNALETLLVDQACAKYLLPELEKALGAAGVTIRGCSRTRSILPRIEAASRSDWTTEYLAPILAVKVVDGPGAAIGHINQYGSGHTDGIVTTNLATARRFLDQVDSASVLVNASTRLSGGGDYGMGAVVGISTGRLHARGPVGARELTTYKWQVRGDGQLRK